MSRVTDNERRVFHEYLDQALDKLETPKNAMKPHWSIHEVPELRDMIMTESYELNHAVNLKSGVKVINELKDLIVISLMAWDKIKRPRRIKNDKK